MLRCSLSRAHTATALTLPPHVAKQLIQRGPAFGGALRLLVEDGHVAARLRHPGTSAAWFCTVCRSEETRR
jgi:hypothetical protein